MSAPLPRRTRPASSAVLRPSTAQSSAKLSRVPSSSALATSSSAASASASVSSRRATHGVTTAHHGDEENARPAPFGGRTVSGKAAAGGPPTGGVRRERVPTGGSVPMSNSDKQLQQREGLGEASSQAELQDGKAAAVDGTNIEVVVRCRCVSSTPLVARPRTLFGADILVSPCAAAGRARRLPRTRPLSSRQPAR